MPSIYKQKCLGFFYDSKRQTYCGKKLINEFFFLLKIFIGMLNAMDEAIGKVVENLKALNLYENSIIIFSSDVKFFLFKFFIFKKHLIINIYILILK